MSLFTIFQLDFSALPAKWRKRPSVQHLWERAMPAIFRAHGALPQWIIDGCLCPGKRPFANSWEGL